MVVQVDQATGSTQLLEVDRATESYVNTFELI